MIVTLNHHTPLVICADAIRTCWQSQEKSDSFTLTLNIPFGLCKSTKVCGKADRALIDRIGNKFKHASTLEHLVYNFSIEGISRALLQELSRHRMASLSVKSTRYTLKELKEEESFINEIELEQVAKDRLQKGVPLFDPFNEEEFKLSFDVERASRYIVLTGNLMVDTMSINSLNGLRRVIKLGVSNDKAKYCLPESYKTELAWTINARSLQNFLSLRSDKAALWEIRDLAHAIYEALPEEHKYLFTHTLKENTHE